MLKWKQGLSTLLQNAYLSRKGVSDVIASAIPQIVGLCSGVVTSVLTARGIGPVGMGQYALAMSLADVATTLSDLGIGTATIRYASRAAAVGDTTLQLAVLRWALKCRLSLVLLVTLVFVFLAPYLARLWHDVLLTPYLRLGLLGGIFSAMASIPVVYLQSTKRFSLYAIVKSSQNAIYFGGILLLSALSLWSLRSLMTINLFASAIGAFAFLMVVPRGAYWNGGECCQGWKERWCQFFSTPTGLTSDDENAHSLPIHNFMRLHMFSTAITLVLGQADLWMMGEFLDAGDIGVYSIAQKFTLPFMVLLRALNTAIWPRASGIVAVEDLFRLFKKTICVCILLALCGFVFALSAPYVATYVFGPAYQRACAVAQILCARCCIQIVGVPLEPVGYGFGLVRVLWRMRTLQVVVLVVSLWCFLPLYGAKGAAVSVLTGEIVNFVLLNAFIYKCYKQCSNKEILVPNAQ